MKKNGTQIYDMTEELFWIFVNNIDKEYQYSLPSDFIKDDPENYHQTIKTKRGNELFEEIEEVLKEK
tara:strand:- start:58 stop:258 length:201 start_codon:yes stop_codon:yes gene_type:complete